MRPVFLLEPVCLALVGIMAAAQGGSSRTLTGTITDSECADANHNRMRMGDTDDACVKACVDAHGATFALYDGKSTYELSDQKAPAAFAGRKVTVTGRLDEKAKRIIVESIAAAK
jgi:hypothetical protein